MRRFPRPASPRSRPWLRPLLLAASALCALLLLLAAQSLSPAPLPPGAACPPAGSAVLVRNAHYLTRGNVGCVRGGAARTGGV